jgi:hypothetical protein
MAANPQRSQAGDSKGDRDQLRETSNPTHYRLGQLDNSVDAHAGHGE